MPLRSVEANQQDENALLPTTSCSSQMTLTASSSSPSAATSLGRMRSPSKLPTLSDIAARLNRDRETTPSNSPAKGQPPPAPATTVDATNGAGGEVARPRLELTGRITGSPKPPSQQNSDRKMISTSSVGSPSKLADAVKVDETLCVSPKAGSSGSCSPTKRMLAKGLPSLEEIRDRMSRKGLADEGPKLTSGSSSPVTLVEKSPEVKQAPAPASVVSKPAVEQKPIVQTAKPGLRVSTNIPANGPRLNHPLPAPPAKSPTYPLRHEWTLFFDTRSTPILPSPTTPTTTTTLTSWEANLRTIGTYSHVATFLNCFSKLHRPSQLPAHSSYHLFKDAIKPMWEDPRNTSGGKWTIMFRQRNPALVDRSWLWLVLGLIGEEMDAGDECCGAVCSVRPRGDRIALWTRGRGREGVEGVGRRLVRLLELEGEAGVVVEFSGHEDRVGWTMLSNPVAVSRTPTMGSFPSVGEKLSPGSGKAPSSPNDKNRSISPNPAAGESYGRLSGQHSSTSGVFGRSSPNPQIGALGQSLGLGIGNSSPGSSPNPNDLGAKKLVGKKSFSPQTGDMAFSWRSGNRSTSPQRKDGERSRSSSPFKP